MASRIRNWRPQPSARYPACLCDRSAGCGSPVFPLGTELPGMIACDLLSGLSSSRVVIAVAWIMLATVSGECQSSSAVQTTGCPIADHQTAVAGRDALGALGVTSPALLEVRAASFQELGHLNLRARTFRSQSDKFRTRFSLSRFF